MSGVRILWKRGLKIDADADSQLYYTLDLDKWLPDGINISGHTIESSDNINVLDSYHEDREILIWLNGLELNTQAWVKFSVTAQVGSHQLMDNWTVYFRGVDH